MSTDVPDADGGNESLRDIIRGHTGRDNPVPSSELAERCGIRDGEANPVTRGRVRQLLRGGIPIGSTQDGYFVIETHAEYRDEIESLYGRIEQIEERVRLLEAAWTGEELQTTLGEIDAQATDDGDTDRDQ